MGLFSKKKPEIIWNENGWTVVQEPDAEKHVLGISCRGEEGKVVEIRIRHNDGEESVGKALVNGENVLPLAIEEFKKLFAEGKVEIK